MQWLPGSLVFFRNGAVTTGLEFWAMMSSPDEILWNSDAAAHLLRRAGFGGTPEDAEVLAAVGLEGAVDRLLADDARDRRTHVPKLPRR